MTPERLSKLERVAANRRFDLTVVLENVHDPHNIAAVMRTCDAVGVAEIFVIDNQVKLNKRIGKKPVAAPINGYKYINLRRLPLA